ncbi:CIA30 family protein [Kordia jejudonensis]|uniref:CIA30 family protein n=1 Tax=Kordia jejudonensis TaxID=1348245 RepID=UPI0006292D66|nr:CIA30 family protein [Kordia jejudonensis]
MSLQLFNFTKNSDISNWYIVNDGVMGGMSQSTFSLNENGVGVFKGNVSLENNGGFSSVRYDIGKTEISEKTTLVIRLKGDGKQYKFRLKENQDDRHTFTTQFETSGDWETIEISLNSLYPSFRGRTLDIGNFSASTFEELGFLIANGKQESFQLELDFIELK